MSGLNDSQIQERYEEQLTKAQGKLTTVNWIDLGEGRPTRLTIFRKVLYSRNDLFDRALIKVYGKDALKSVERARSESISPRKSQFGSRSFVGSSRYGSVARSNPGDKSSIRAPSEEPFLSTPGRPESTFNDDDSAMEGIAFGEETHTTPTTNTGRRIPDPAVEEYQKRMERYPDDGPYDLVNYDIQDPYLRKLGDILQVAIETIPDKTIQDELKSVQWNQEYLRHKPNGWYLTSIIDKIKVNLDKSRYPSVLAEMVAQLTAEGLRVRSDLDSKTKQCDWTEQHVKDLKEENMKRALEMQADITRKEGEIAEKDKAILQKTADVTERDVTVANLREKVLELDRRATDHGKSAEKSDRELAEKTQEVNDKATELKDQKTKIAELTARILDMERKTQDFDEKTKALAEKDTTIADLKTEISQVKQQVTDRSNEVAEANIKLQQRILEVGRQATTIEGKDAVIADLNAKVMKADERVADGNTVAENAKTELKERDQKITGLQNQLTAADASLQTETSAHATTVADLDNEKQEVARLQNQLTAANASLQTETSAHATAVVDLDNEKQEVARLQNQLNAANTHLQGATTASIALAERSQEITRLKDVLVMNKNESSSRKREFLSLQNDLNVLRAKTSPSGLPKSVIDVIGEKEERENFVDILRGDTDLRKEWEDMSSKARTTVNYAKRKKTTPGRRRVAYSLSVEARKRETAWGLEK